MVDGAPKAPGQSFIEVGGRRSEQPKREGTLFLRTMTQKPTKAEGFGSQPDAGQQMPT